MYKYSDKPRSSMIARAALLVLFTGMTASCEGAKGISGIETKISSISSSSIPSWVAPVIIKYPVRINKDSYVAVSKYFDYRSLVEWPEASFDSVVTTDKYNDYLEGGQACARRGYWCRRDGYAAANYIMWSTYYAHAHDSP